MANINNNNFQSFKIKINREEYWDFVLNKDIEDVFRVNKSDISKDNLISYLDMGSNFCFDGQKFISEKDFFWDKSIVVKYDLKNIGFTGLDNGLIPFRRDIITNKEFLDIYQNSKYTIGEYDNRLVFHNVSGGTNQYVYPYEYDGKVLKLDGGFLQTCFKTENCKYQVLPDNMDLGDVMCYEFTLKPLIKEINSKTLNSKYPNNKGIFFYIGTRAENKWIYLYEDDEYIEDAKIDKKTYRKESFLDMSISEGYMIDGFNNSTEFERYEYFDLIVDVDNMLCNHFNDCKYVDICDFFGDDYLSSIDSMGDDIEYIEDEINISDYIYRIEDMFTIGTYESYKDYSNPFLLLDRTCNGYNVKNWSKDSFVRYFGVRNTFNENLFLLLNRTPNGYNIRTIEELKVKYDEKYNLYKDLYENALAFRITDEGKIGYRFLVKDCTNLSSYKIEEGYSKEGVVKTNEWNIINVKIMYSNKEMIFNFYVNGKLVFISKPLPKLNLRKLDDIYEKQESVPFNMSLGGGTQGLSETILPNYMINPYRTYPLEEHFGGSFIGEIKSFKIYNENMDYEKIKNNFTFQIGRINEK